VSNYRYGLTALYRISSCCPYERDTPKFPHNASGTVILVAILHRSSAGCSVAYSEAEYVCTLEITFASKSLASVHEVMNSIYPNEEVPTN
jgi:hypothetical protein